MHNPLDFSGKVALVTGCPASENVFAVTSNASCPSCLHQLHIHRTSQKAIGQEN